MTATVMIRLLASALIAISCANLRAETWPQFRGANADGVAGSPCPVRWDSATNIRWQIDVPGEGWSCPVVWDETLFLTAAVPSERSDDGNSRPQPYQGGGGRQRSDLMADTYRWEVICLDAKTGNVRWRRTAQEGRPSIPRHSSNSYATETPITDGERVYAYFGMTGLFCYDINGGLQWEKDLGSYEMRAGWGTASSPILFEGMLYLQIDNSQQSFLVALDAATGEEVWRTDRNEPSQYSSPIIWQNSQRNELIAGGQVCRAYDPRNGSLLWELDMEKGRSSATPLAVGDRLYVGTELRDRGGSDDGGGFLFAITPGGTGDITPRQGISASDDVAWKLARSGIQMASPVLCRGHLYLLERRSGVLHCINAETGRVAYRQRMRGARAFWSSPWTSGGKVFCLDAGGTTYVIEGGPEFKLLAENVIAEQTWSSPAVVDGMIFLRTIDHLYCIADESDKSDDP